MMYFTCVFFPVNLFVFYDCSNMQVCLFREVFIRIAPLSKLDALKESLKLFMKHFLRPKRSKSSPGLNQKFQIEDKERSLETRINIAINALSGN